MLTFILFSYLCLHLYKLSGESEFNCDSGFTDVPHMRDSAEFIQSSDNHSYSGEDNSDDASSDNSNLSNISGMNWKPMAGSLNWVS